MHGDAFRARHSTRSEQHGVRVARHEQVRSARKAVFGAQQRCFSDGVANTGPWRLPERTTYYKRVS